MRQVGDVDAAHESRRNRILERLQVTGSRFERAKMLHERDLLNDYCAWLRERVGIPIGLWAVVTDRITPTMFGNALIDGHEELLDPYGGGEVVNQQVREDYAYLLIRRTA